MLFTEVKFILLPFKWLLFVLLAVFVTFASAWELVTTLLLLLPTSVVIVLLLPIALALASFWLANTDATDTIFCVGCPGCVTIFWTWPTVGTNNEKKKRVAIRQTVHDSNELIGTLGRLQFLFWFLNRNFRSRKMYLL